VIAAVIVDFMLIIETLQQRRKGIGKILILAPANINFSSAFCRAMPSITTVYAVMRCPSVSK